MCVDTPTIYFLESIIRIRRVSDWLRASSILKVALYVMKQQVMTLIPWLIAVYAAICAVVYFGNRLFMYFPNQTNAAPAEAGLDHVKEIEIAAADGVTLVAWYASARNDKPTILYFHGNAANAANRAPRIRIDPGAWLWRSLPEQSRLWRLRRTTHGRGQCRRCDRGLRSLDSARSAPNQDRRLRGVA